VLQALFDAVAHALWKLEHISAVHSHYGENHVHNETVEAAANEQPNPPAAPYKYGSPADLHFGSGITFSFFVHSKVQDFNTLHSIINPQAFIGLDDPPPRLA
jgi:hypothetical protein